MEMKGLSGYIHFRPVIARSVATRRAIHVFIFLSNKDLHPAPATAGHAFNPVPEQSPVVKIDEARPVVERTKCIVNFYYGAKLGTGYAFQFSTQ